MRIAVSGATGLIGGELVRQLLARGDEVVALARDAGKARRQLPVQVEIVGADLEHQELLPGALASCRGVVHLAGETISKRWTTAWKERIRQSRVLTTRHIVASIAAATPPPAVLLSASAVGIYGDREDELLDEGAAQRINPGSGFLADVARAWESEASGAPAAVRQVSLRSGVVLATQGGAFPKMLLPFRLGLGGPLGSGRQWMPWIHLADHVALLLHALDNAKIEGPLNLVAPQPVTNRDFTRSLGRALRRPAILPAPAFALRLALGEMSALLLESQRAVPKKALASGFVFRFPTLEAALDDLL